MNIRYVTILCPARFCWVGREVLESLQMSVESLDIEPEPTWLELPLDSPPSRRDERDRRQGDVELELNDDDEPPPDVIVIELV